MHVFYEQKIQEVCIAFHFPHKIQATAIIYFKRFYLQWSVMEHHPKHIMLACIYLSCKIEENHVSAKDLGRGIHQDHQMILNNELIVLQSLGFDLIVYSPYRALEGFLDNMEEFCRMNNGQFERLKMALSALRASNEVHQVHFDRYLESIFSRQHADHTIIELHGGLNSIDSLVRDFKIPSAKDMKHIDRKLKHCWEPNSQEDKKREKRSKHKPKKLVDPTAS